MATVNHTSSITAENAVITWTPLVVSTSDVGQAFDALGWAPVSVQIGIVTAPYSGTFALEASNDGTTWTSLETSASFNLKAYKALHFRPKVSGSSGQVKCVVLFEKI